MRSLVRICSLPNPPISAWEVCRTVSIVANPQFLRFLKTNFAGEDPNPLGKLQPKKLEKIKSIDLNQYLLLLSTLVVY